MAFAQNREQLAAWVKTAKEKGASREEIEVVVRDYQQREKANKERNFKLQKKTTEGVASKFLGSRFNNTLNEAIRSGKLDRAKAAQAKIAFETGRARKAGREDTSGFISSAADKIQKDLRAGDTQSAAEKLNILKSTASQIKEQEDQPRTTGEALAQTITRTTPELREKRAAQLTELQEERAEQAESLKEGVLGTLGGVAFGLQKRTEPLLQKLADVTGVNMPSLEERFEQSGIKRNEIGEFIGAATSVIPDILVGGAASIRAEKALVKKFPKLKNFKTIRNILAGLATIPAIEAVETTLTGELP